MTTRTNRTGSRGPGHARAVAARPESDADLVARMAQEAFLPFSIVVLAWFVATSAVAGR